MVQAIPLANGNEHVTSSKIINVDSLLKELSIHEKVLLLGGKNFWHLNDLPHRGIPSVRLSDGPNGCRGIAFFNGTPSNCFPCATGLAASFDLTFARAVGTQFAHEARVKGVHVLLGPTVNVQRSPLAGRGFEMFSEDPLLSGLIAAAYVNGVQSQGVAATMKHFAGNEQEFERFKSDSIISPRALREIYLEPFRIANKLASPKCYMTGYNKLNGLHCSENHELLGILREEWGYDGLIMSDWTGTVSSCESIKAGLDVEMPGPPAYRGACTMRDLQCGKLVPADIDARARAVLNLVASAQRSGIPFDAEESYIDTPESRALLREAAVNAVVLLKNDRAVLPLKEAKTIAVIGSNARVAITSGGGSAQLLSTYTVSPLQGITEAAGSMGAQVEYTTGCQSYKLLPIATPLLSHPNAKGVNEVAQIDFWLEQPVVDFDTIQYVDIPQVPDHSLLCNTAFAFMVENVPKHILEGFPYFRYTTYLTPDRSGDWHLSLASVGKSVLFVDGVSVADNIDWVAGETFFGMGSTERICTVRGLQAGTPIKVEIRSWARQEQRGSPVRIAGAVRLGAAPILDDQEAIDQAVELAQRSDAIIVVVGLNEDFECEGHDRKVMQLPGTSDRLVEAVLDIRPDAVIVTQSGMPVAMPWIGKASTVVHAFYGGNDLGGGLADVLFGRANPSSRLPVTFPVLARDVPSDVGFGIKSASSLRAYYQEDIYVGYRHFDRSGVAPLFPFGHGLSYTSFEYSNLFVTPISMFSSQKEVSFTVSFDVENTGYTAGSEVSQIYIRDVQSSFPRPDKELKGVAKTFLKPGEKRSVIIELNRDALKFWNDLRNTWVAEKGEFEVIVAQSAEVTVLQGVLSLEENVEWLGL